ncbi:MAG: hypothetical protein CND04_02175 [Candidatus Actinomarinales bacterium MED-G02]|nr:MAG: hypothetical protein CND04_02175 [Candidatus Actinomarinales bacterium MED-G02]
MQIVRAKYENEIFYGDLYEGKVTRYDGSPFVVWENTEETYDLDEIELLAPVLPSKVIAVAKNYAKHAAEMGLPEYSENMPEFPVIFIKPSTSVIGSGQKVKYPTIGEHVDIEAELALVISKVSKNIDQNNWMDHVLGLTIANDLSERVLQGKTGHFTRAKGFDTFCPLGPYIQTDFIESPELQIKSYVNGELKQNGNTRDMMFKIGEILEFVSSIMTLLPGDVILTGTPEGVSRVDRGDEIKIDIETLGTQTNTVE